MERIGFVSNIYRESWRQLITMVLNYEELDQKPPLGAFLIGRDGQRRILARVEKVYYKPVLVQDYNRALAMGQLNQEKADETSVRSINFMHYDLVLLGEIDLGTGDYDAGIRDVPSLMDIQFYLPDKEELQKIVSAKIPVEEEEEQYPFKIGVLQYGTSDRYTPKGVDIEFNIANFFPKRTAVFGKTGYGKSNLIKTIIVLMNEHDDSVGQLILDVNGEYGFDETGTDQGLISVLGERVVVYTNRDVETSVEGQIRPIRFNFYDEPQLGAQLRRAQIIDRRSPIYIDELAETPNDEILQRAKNNSLKAAWWCALHSIGFEIPTEEEYRYWLPTQREWREQRPEKVSKKGNVWGIENVVEYVEWCRENTDSYGSDTVSNMLRYAGQFRFLRELHSPDATTN
jgi:energy-coupling factor transporter ATP-binding protein EcfA2